MIVRGADAHLAFMESIRPFYRNPVIEIIILFAVCSQVLTGILLARKRWKEQAGTFDKLQLWSGLYFVYFLSMHTGAVLIGRYVLNLDTNLYFGAAPLNNTPLKFYFIFHYGLAMLAFFIHVGCAHHTKMKKYIAEETARRQSIFFMLFGVIVTVVVLFKMMKLFIPVEYHYLPFGNY